MQIKNYYYVLLINLQSESNLDFENKSTILSWLNTLHAQNVPNLLVTIVWSNSADANQ
jgi:hypothetical protein